MAREFPTRLENFEDWVKKMKLNAQVDRPARTSATPKASKGKRVSKRRRKRFRRKRAPQE